MRLRAAAPEVRVLIFKLIVSLRSMGQMRDWFLNHMRIGFTALRKNKNIWKCACLGPLRSCSTSKRFGSVSLAHGGTPCATISPVCAMLALVVYVVLIARNWCFNAHSCVLCLLAGLQLSIRMKFLALCALPRSSGKWLCFGFLNRGTACSVLSPSDLRDSNGLF